MEVMYLPKIAPTDFEAFRKFMKDEVGATFEEWTQRVRNRFAEYRDTNTIVETYVNPDEFKRFCDGEGCAYNGMSLLSFAEFVGKTNA